MILTWNNVVLQGQCILMVNFLLKKRGIIGKELLHAPLLYLN